MMIWLAANIGTILVLFVLFAVVLTAVYSMRRDRQRGKFSCGAGCGGSCSGCAGCGGCHG